jgi:hypothetical protein
MANRDRRSWTSRGVVLLDMTDLRMTSLDMVYVAVQLSMHTRSYRAAVFKRSWEVSLSLANPWAVLCC